MHRARPTRARLAGGGVRVLRTHPAVLTLLAFALWTGFLWAYRRVVIPKPWEPVMFRGVILNKGFTQIGGPVGLLMASRVYWAPAGGIAVAAIVVFGLARRWSVYIIAAACFAAASLCSQFVGTDGFWATWIFDSSLWR